MIIHDHCWVELHVDIIIHRFRASSRIEWQRYHFVITNDIFLGESARVCKLLARKGRLLLKWILNARCYLVYECITRFFTYKGDFMLFMIHIHVHILHGKPCLIMYCSYFCLCHECILYPQPFPLN